MKTTLKDIAEDTGYSVATVSRVLNGSTKISSSTQEIILRSARRLEYLSPKQKKTDQAKEFLNVALICSDFTEGEFYVSFFNGLNRAAKKNNIRLSLIGITNPNDEVVPLLKEISLHYYDAAILFIPEYKRLDYEEIQSKLPNGFPIISNAPIENPVFPTITFDGYSGGHLAAQHLKSQGYTELGLIQGPLERSESRYRSNGFKDYIQQHDKLNLCWVYNGDFTYESGFKSFSAFQKLKNKPRAIFGANDDMANGFMESGKGSNIHFPEDVAIIGYDNLPVCRHNHPTISSVDTNYEALGMTTMKHLRDSVEASGQNSSMLSFVPVSVVHRKSS